ncbi:hypothetical protein KC332_g14035 [Hortaea werneckii]|uniref:Uncharacterized protein n=1 Tax=Hortaea werneckii EXF-2000 TaxID=1157616 RepID=A0A1Z5SRN7_HORWE|nr:hypothetical protein KC358_g14097 [Hortaea werneckii]OTA23388.1 hypothetical protein BTJ68_14186 [Hortaea werneckii EXF-2000]KAI6807775.1 hypothetical protein KC350_g13634 [Hortaea werneckii]KAI6908300.1 hypothetical protein KC348_g13891 [Hortaea werneckii]KAI6925201.1 hypothetical protein KC341_g13582 [Hortaea werneckii]
MSTNDEATVIQADDHKRSYGRGGAGNMRLPSVVAAAQDEPELAKEAVNGRRRTSSIRSTKSNSSSSSARRKGSIVDKLLRRGSKDEEGEEKEQVDSGKGKQASE